MAIVQPNELDFNDKKFSMIIYGSPGVGKTTLALSAPNPVLLDFDRGISRVRSEHRKATSVCSTYEEVLADIHSPELSQYDTIIIDTGGSFVTFLKDWAFRTRPGCKTKSGDFNGLKGYGEVKTEFARFTEDIKTRLNKNIIYVFHTEEKQDKDGNPVQRLLCEGSVRNTVWNPCDFGGYVQMIGSTRDICFTPEQEFFAKGCHGIGGHIPIPRLCESDINNFVTKLFDTAKQNIIREQAAFEPIKAQYDATMTAVKNLLDAVTDVESCNSALRAIEALDHALTSKKEAGALLSAKAKTLNLVYDKGEKAYKLKDITPSEG